MTDSNQTGDSVDLVADSLAPDGPDTLRQLFNAAGARAPEVIWSPKEAELRSSLLRSFARICDRYRDSRGAIRSNAIRLEDFGGLTEWLMLIDVDKDGADFVYTFYGSSIAEQYGRDMTGKRTSEFTGHIGTFFAGLYKAALKRGETVYSEHEPPASVFVRVWQRLIVPLSDAEGRIIRFLVLNVPDNELRAGLELMVDPVFVLTADEKVLYANRAAQTLFGAASHQSAPETFSALTNVPLDIALSPDEMLSQHRVEDSVQLTIREDIVERLVMTVSAAQHKGAAYYVVVMRMIGH